MNPFVKYSLARLGLFALVAAVLLVLPIPLDRVLLLGIALIVSAILSFVLLRGLRNEVAGQIAASSQRRAAERERLRVAMAGEDQPAASGPPVGQPVDLKASGPKTVGGPASETAAAESPVDPNRTGTAPST